MGFLRIAAGLALALLAGGAAALEGTAQSSDQSAAAQVERQQVQPLNNEPVWSAVRTGVAGSTATTGREAGVLIQSSGERWRLLRNDGVKPLGVAAIVLALLAVGAFYLWKGPQKLHGQLSGRMIFRFHYYERFIHWSIAILFLLLAASGLILLFGRHILLPLIGPTLFGWLGQFSKLVHNLGGPLFAIAMVAGVINFMRDCLPRAHDLNWLRKGGGYFDGSHVPAGKFNAGQKLWFWGGLLGMGTLVSISGFVLDFPNFDQTRATMQIFQLSHAIIAVLFIAGSVFHIYLGSMGQVGAYAAMRDGWVDETWAKEHHELWYNDVKAGRVPGPPPGNTAQARPATPASP